MKRITCFFILTLFVLIIQGCSNDREGQFLPTNLSLMNSVLSDDYFNNGEEENCRIIVQFKSIDSIPAKQLNVKNMDVRSIQPLVQKYQLQSVRRISSDNVLAKIKERHKKMKLRSGRDIEKNINKLQRLVVLEYDAITKEQSEEILGQLRNNPEVERAELDKKEKALSVPNDEFYLWQWGMDKIQAPLAWDITTGSSDVIVAVIDSGVDYNHKDLINNCIAGYDFANNDSDPMDDDEHGTHVAGIVAAQGNNSIGVAGVAWNTKIMPLKFLEDGTGWNSDAISCIDYAIANGANIINASWGSYEYDQSLYDAIKRARDAGVLFVAAAGNDNLDNDIEHNYPSSYNLDNIIAVACSEERDFLYNSNYGINSVDLAAPGISILSTIPYDVYTWLHGTSMAAPHVSGVAALLKSIYPDITYKIIRRRILTSVDKNSDFQGMVATGGRLNAYTSLINNNSGPFNYDTSTLFGSNYYASPQYGNVVTELRDMNGDGLPDYLGYYNYNTSEHGLWVAINNWSGFNEPTNWGSADLFGSIYYAMPKWGENSELRDMDGDGILDYCAHYNYNTSQYGLWVASSYKSIFTNPTNWGSAELFGNNNYAKPHWGDYSELRDMNGDGFPDYLACYNFNTSEPDKFGLWVAINRMSELIPTAEFATPVNWGTAQLFGNENYSKPHWGNYSQLVDMNNDGLPDYVAHYNYNTNQYGLWVAINNGAGFNTPTNYRSAERFGSNYCAMPLTIDSGSTYRELLDMNGDGLPDYISHYNYTNNQFGLWVAINNGIEFDPPANWGTAAIFDNNNYALPQWGNYSELRDMNGDGRPDYLAWYNYNTSDPNKYGIWVAINNGTGFDPPVNWETSVQFGSNYCAMPHTFEGDTVYREVRDINGDDLPDYLVHYNYETSEFGLWVLINNGEWF